MKPGPIKRIIQLFALLALLLPAVPAGATQSGGVDLRIWTVNAAGEPVYDICYTLVEYSNLGCDENLDGNVLFEDVAPGRYYIEPTMHPDGFYWADPFTILVDELHTDHVVEAFEYRGSNTGSGNQSAEIMYKDVHLITRDPETGDVIYDACYELAGYSQIGCDQNQDGHITFADIPWGQYTIRQTTTPAGYEPMEDYVVNITGGPQDYYDPMVILISQGELQAPRGHVNMSVVFYDPYYGVRVEMEENCAQVWHDDDPVSLVGCDEDVVDGQIDFMHMEFDSSDSGFSLDAMAACPYGVVPGSEFQLLWFGQHTVTVFVQVSSDAGSGC